MVEKKFFITSDLGLHAKYCTMLVKTCNDFAAKATLSCRGITADFKSIMGVMALGVSAGEVITINIAGSDEVEAMKRLSLQLSEEKIAKEI